VLEGCIPALIGVVSMDDDGSAPVFMGKLEGSNGTESAMPPERAVVAVGAMTGSDVDLFVEITDEASASSLFITVRPVMPRFDDMP
jgi:hypothetical protein